jgi:ABC-2 type transport system permease protein
VTTATLPLILTPKWRTTMTRLREERSGQGGRLLLVGSVGLIFWLAVFGVLYRVLRYFRGVEEIGPLLAGKLLALALLSFLAILLLSNIITALSSFFLAKDLDLLVSSPVDWLPFYCAKLAETLLHSSWMVILMVVPMLTAYGVIYDGGWLFAPYAILICGPLFLIPTIIGSATTLVLVNVFPARRTRDLLSIIAIGAAGVLVLLFRVVRPEQLARPEGFQSLVDFITLLRTPTSPLLPSEWASNSLMGYLVGPFDPLPLLLLWTTAASLAVFGAMLHSGLYATGFTKAQEGAERFVRGWVWKAVLNPLLARMSVAKREFIIKDIKLFFRDTTQWSQLILLGVLVVIYLFNIQALPLFRGERVPFFLVSVISFLNLGLAGFVLASIAARFIFPAISLEGRQMWLLRSSPLDLRALMWSKYWIGTVPLLVLALTITVVTNVLLKATPFMMTVGTVTIVLLTFAVGAMALGFGALYPQFETENAAQIPTSFGGLVFMMTTIALLATVIVIEAVPVYSYMRSVYQGEEVGITPTMLAAFAGVTALCVVATIVPLRIGLTRMENFEF